MKTEIKYTSDGKKVAVVGKLNAQETIVQEIFVTENGSELPSGENFVTKSLHDTPVESWKEKRLRELEASYEKTNRELVDKIDSLNRKYREQSALMNAKIKSMDMLQKNLSEGDFDRLVDFMSGNCKYVVKLGWSPKISLFDKELIDNWEGRFDAIRLVSVFGDSDGNVKYRLNQYKDGSGSWEEIVPFGTHEQAVEYFRDFIFNKALEKGVTYDMIKISEEYGFDLPIDAMRDFYNKEKVKADKSVEDATDKLNKAIQCVSDVKKTIKKLRK